MNIEIRSAQAADLEVLQDIYYRSRHQTFTWAEPESFQLTDFASATQDEPMLVATAGGKLVGFVSWWPPEDFVHNLFVDPDHLRLGIGRLLLEACLAQIGRPASLKCLQDNANARAFYERHGWQIIGDGASAGGSYYLMELAE